MYQKLILTTLIILVMVVLTSTVAAHSYNTRTSDHPLRYITYAVYPVGVAGEYLVLRPIHWIVSRPVLCKIFGHKPKPEDKYFEW